MLRNLSKLTVARGWGNVFRVQQNSFDMRIQQQSIIWREGKRLTKSSQFCGPLFLIDKSTFFEGLAKIETERIQIILANSHSLLTKTLHLATETNLLVTETNGAHNQF